MILTIFTFAIILTVLVMIHELGHYTVARMIGVKVEEFGFGLPPRIFGKLYKGTIYSINWLPVGGFVKLAGEDTESEIESKKHVHGSKTKEYFWARSKKERAAILVAGVCMNLLLSIVLTAGLLMHGIKEPSGRVRIESVVDGSPAALAGLRVGDVVVSIESAITMNVNPPKALKSPDDLISETKTLAGSPAKLIIERNGVRETVVVTPRKDPPKGQGSMGIAITDLEIKKYSVIEAPYKAITITFTRAWMMLTGIATTLWGLITFKQLSPDVAGPIGIAQVTGQAVKFGFAAVVDFASILSLNLAVLNILPLPALDGGRLAFVVLEKIIGKRIRPAFEKQTHQIGMLVLLILVVLISIHDVLRLARGG